MRNKTFIHIRFFLNIISSHTSVVFTQFFSNMLLTLVSMVMPIIISVIIDHVFYNKNIEALNRLILIYLVLFLSVQFFRLMGLIAWQFLSNTLILDLKKRIFVCLMKAKAVFLMRKSTGTVMEHFGDVDEILNLIDINIVACINSIIQLILLMMVIALIDIRYALLLSFTIPTSFILTKSIGRKTNYLSRLQREIRGKYTGWLFDILGGLREIKILRSSKVIQRLFVHQNIELIRVSNKTSKLNVISNILLGLNSLLIDLSLYILTAFLIMQDEITIGLFVAVLQYFTQSKVLFDSIINSLISFKKKQVHLEKTRSILAIEQEENIGNVLNIKGETIKFDHVFFEYAKGFPILKNLNFSLNAGDLVSFIGESGIGKSTMGYLLVRFFEPTQGDIYIDNVNLNMYSLSNLRKDIGVVYQDFKIFDDSIKNNLLLLNKDASDEYIEDICKKVDIYDFIQQLPDGINTRIGVDGFDISGGQKQRIALARVLMKNPKILILDESTSSLDSKTEQRIIRTLNLLKENRIVILISHKLSTVIDSDKIFLIDDGQIVIEGTHKELITNSTTYKKMFNKECITQKEENHDKA